MTTTAVSNWYISMEYTNSIKPEAEEACTGTAFEDKLTASETSSVGKEVLGIGFLEVGNNHAYGISATYSDASTSDNPIISVLVTKGKNDVEKHEISINDINVSNATDIEMFALCSYADATGNGVGGTFSSWQALKYYRINAEHLGQFDGIDTEEAFLTLKQDWMTMVSSMIGHYMDAGIFDQALEGNKLLDMFNQCTDVDNEKAVSSTLVDSHSIIQQRIKELSEKLQNGEIEQKYAIGAGEFTEKEWDKLMSEYDEMQDAIKELMRDRHEERVEQLEKQEEVNDDLKAQKIMIASLEGTDSYIYSDALFSICHVPTGETANVYKAENYTEDNPVYIVKGRDIDGNDYEQKINANDIDPNNCSYIEVLTWSVHTGNSTPENYLKLSRMRGEAGEVSYLESMDFTVVIEKLMEEMKTVGAVNDYQEYKRLLEEFKNSKGGIV